MSTEQPRTPVSLARGGASTTAVDFEAIFAVAPGVHLVLAPDAPHFTMLAASDERLAATLSTREETIGRPLFNVFADANPDNAEPSGVANLRASLEAVLETRAPHRMAVQRFDLRRPDGGWEVRYWAPRNVPVLESESRTVRYIVHHVLDVTELLLEREAAVAADRKAAELRAVLESMSDGVYIGSANGIAIANQAALEQLGYTRREDLNRGIGTLAEEIRTRDAATGEVIPAERQAFVRALSGERVVQDVVVRHRLTGQDRVMHCVAAPVVVGGAVIAAVSVNTDVTERRAVDAALRESEQQFRDMADAVPQIVWRVDDDGGNEFFNRQWFLYTGAPEASISVTEVTERYVHPDDRELTTTRFAEAQREVRTFEVEHRIRAADGSYRWFLVRAEPSRDPVSGAVVRWFGASVDIHGRKEAERERERLLRDTDAARAEAERANRAKSEFLAVMSHELRTPLNAIGGYAELIELGIHGPVTDAQRTALARIQTSQRHLLGLIAGVLDYSRVEAGAVTYRLADVPVAEAVAEAETLVAPQIRANGLRYAWSGAARGLLVRADREKLQQILLNLLGNAIKFTNPRDGVPGQIEVGCTVVNDGDGDGDREGAAAGGRVCVHVRDTGEGIATSELVRVFEPFVQADQRLTRPHAGVGLGLAISRDLARGMGGDLTVESRVGQGSTFTLSLPAAVASAAGIGSSPPGSTPTPA